MTNLFIRIISAFTGKGFDEGEKGAKKFKKELDALKREVGLGIGLGVVLRELTDFGVGSIKAAEEGRTVGRAFTNLSGGAAQATENMEAMRAATRDLVSETEQQRIANQLLGMNIVQTAGELGEVVEVSRRLGKEFRGLGAAEAADEFAIMMSNMSVQRLDTFGISSGAVRKRIDELMASTKGMTREEAFFQATMEEAHKTLARLGPEAKTTTDRVSELGARWADFQAAFGKMVTGEEVGILDTLITSATVFVEKLTEGANAWGGIFSQINAVGNLLEQKLGGAINLLGQGTNVLNKAIGVLFPQIGAFNFLLGQVGESVGEAGQRLAEEARETQEQSNEEIKQGETEQADELLNIKRELGRELLDIQAETDDQLADEAKSFAEEQVSLEEDYADNIADIRKRSGKQLVKLQRDLQKDLAKEDTDLKKDLTKLEKDQSERVQEFQEKSAKEEKRQRKLDKIDALADERLFQFELRQLAAEGEGNAIKAALERRAIEEEIAREKSEVEGQIEDEKAKETIESIQEEGEERRAQLLLDNQERKALLEERHAEEVAELNEQLAEQIQAENESFAERKADLQEHYDERVTEIKEGEAEALAEVGQALTETEDMTTEKLAQLTPIARAIGEDVGKEFAEGITEGYRQNQRIERLIGQASAGGIQPMTAEERERIRQLSGGGAGFQNEGIVRGRMGIAHRGEVVLNPQGGSLGGGIIQIGGQQFIASHAAELARAINGQRQRDMQSLVDQLAALMD